ncbi:MAG: hypothetical protein HYT12_04770 [Candidatus Liptonbacteria bacterium]|nr:hypothetical protein [Candidatus Liptonbacteria bacterium]
MTKKMNFPLALITSMALLAYIISPVATVLLQPNVVYAGQPFATINLNTINGQTSPFTSCLTSPITVIGSGTIDPAGLISQYKVEVVWANGDIEDNIPITLLNNTSPYSYEFTAGPHPYATSVSAITIKIYHVQPPGEDGQGDDSETIQVCITPPPPPPVATSTLTLVKEVDNGDGGDALETDWTLSAGGPTPISGVTGDLSITGAVVDPGTYNLSESGGPTGYNPSDWLCVGGTQDDGDTVTIAEGENATCTITNTFGYAGFISGYKWHDLDGNGEWDDGEPGLDGWNIYMNSWDFSTETDENGYYSFSSLPDGEYFVCEESPLPDGWIQTYPDENREDWCFAGQPTGQRVTIEGGNSVEEINFGNWTGEEESLSASIFGFKYDWDSEEGLFGWIITIIGNEIDDFAETNAEGEYRFTNLDPGTYTVCEEQQEGWTQMEPDSEDGCYEVVIDEGEESG